MDIHAPEGPTHSLKDFFIHIVIVTIGILIALGLEGVRETIHEHHQISETRELFQRELSFNQQQLSHERAALQKSIRQIDTLLPNLDQLNAKPGAIASVLHSRDPGFYFFNATTWDAALSTGVLGHMSPSEVNRLAGESLGVRHYTDVADQANMHWMEVQSAFQAHPTLNPQQLEDGRQKLQLFRLYCNTMDHLLNELEGTNRQELEQK
jgi:hypothetical protein